MLMLLIDFAEGYVKWDDEDDLNRNDWQGVLPDGVYNEDTLQRFCCRLVANYDNRTMQYTAILTAV